MKNENRVNLSNYTEIDRNSFLNLVQNETVMKFVDGPLDKEFAKKLFDSFLSGTKDIVWSHKRESQKACLLVMLPSSTSHKIQSSNFSFIFCPNFGKRESRLLLDAKSYRFQMNLNRLRS